MYRVCTVKNVPGAIFWSLMMAVFVVLGIIITLVFVLVFEVLEAITGDDSDRFRV